MASSHPSAPLSDDPNALDDLTPPALSPRAKVKGYTVAKRFRDPIPGMQEVLAEDSAGARVVLRVPPDHHFAARLRAEAELSRKHPHQAIVQSVGVVELGRWPVQVLEHVEGLRLDALISSTGALPPEAVCRIGARLGQALVELHSRKPVLHHGALAGDRVHVDIDGDVRLRDLGRLWVETSERHQSPERRAGGGRSAQDDLYALGVLLLEAALGEPLDIAGTDGSGTLDPRVLDGLIPDRLVDALAALVAPLQQRLQTADAVVRIFSSLEAGFGDGAVALRLAVAHGKELEPPTPAPRVDPDTLPMDDTLPLAPVIPISPHLPRNLHGGPHGVLPARTQPTLKSIDPDSIAPKSDPGPSWDEVGPPGGHKSPLGMIVMGGLIGLIVVGAAAAKLGVLASAPSAGDAQATEAAIAALIPPVDIDAEPAAAPTPKAARPAIEEPAAAIPASTPDDDAARVVAALRAAAAQAHGVAAPAAAAEPEAAAPTKTQKAVKLVKVAKAEKAVKPAKVAPPAPVAKPEKVAKAPKAAPDKQDKSDGASFFDVEAPRPELTLEASAGMRRRAEEKLASCNLQKPVFGVVHVAGGKIRISTDPRNACVERVLGAALKGYMASEDQPFELTPRGR